LVLVAAQEALADAGLSTESWTAEVGAMFDRGWDADAVAMPLLTRVIREGGQATSPLLFSQSVANAPLGAIGQHLGIRGPHVMTMGGGALYLAVCALRSGEAKAIVAGGMDELEANRLVALDACGLVDAGAASQHLGPSTPRTLGEGAVAIVLEREDSARARGARSYARVLAIEHQLGRSHVRGFCQPRTPEWAEQEASLFVRSRRDRAHLGLVVGGKMHALGRYLGESLGMGCAAALAFAACALRRREVPCATLAMGAGVLPVDGDLAFVQDAGFEGQLFACLLERDVS
jgi:hypothetical protein